MLRFRPHVPDVLVRRNRIRQEPVRDGRLHRRKVERRHAMPHVEKHPALPRPPRRVDYLPLLHDAVRPRMEAVRQHVPASEKVELLGYRPVIRVPAVAEQYRPARSLGDIQRALHYHPGVRVSTRVHARVHRQPPDQLTAVLDRRHACVHVQIIYVPERRRPRYPFPAARDAHSQPNPRLRSVNDSVPVERPVIRPAVALRENRRRPPWKYLNVRVYPVLPVRRRRMSMKIDQPRQQYSVRKIQNPGGRPPNARPRRHYPVPRHRHCTWSIQTRIGAKHTPRANNQVISRFIHILYLPFKEFRSTQDRRQTTSLHHAPYVLHVTFYFLRSNPVNRIAARPP